eukprot:Nk52_evm1s850 gene=Nk52_evmTU1s850
MYTSGVDFGVYDGVEVKKGGVTTYNDQDTNMFVGVAAKFDVEGTIAITVDGKPVGYVPGNPGDKFYYEDVVDESNELYVMITPNLVKDGTVLSTTNSGVLKLQFDPLNGVRDVTFHIIPSQSGISCYLVESSN